MDRAVPMRVSGSAVSLIHPSEGLIGMWAVACGALAGSGGVPERAALGPLLYLLLLASLGWVAGWQLITGTDWFRPLATGWPPARPAHLPAPPYTRPGSPAGRLWQRANAFVGWWRETFWPAVSGAIAGLGATIVLAVTFNLLLSGGDGPAQDVVRRSSALFVALVGIGLAWRRHEREWLAGRAVVLVALPWLAGHLVMAEVTQISAALALLFTLAAWGLERLAHGLRAGGWPAVAAQGMVVAALVGLKQPLAAGMAGALLLLESALLPALAGGADPRRVARGMRPWLLAMMLLAAVALP